MVLVVSVIVMIMLRAIVRMVLVVILIEVYNDYVMNDGDGVKIWCWWCK